MAKRSKQPVQRGVARNNIRISRPVDFEGESIELFSSKVGRAIEGAGTTRSVGSMALGLLGGAAFGRLYTRLSPRDRKSIDISAVDAALKEGFKSRPRTVDLSIEGVGLFGRKRGKQWEPVVRLGFSAILSNNPEIRNDYDLLNSILDNCKMPTINVDPKRPLHISFGDIYTDHITRGQGDNPHLLIPAGITTPESVPLFMVKSKEVPQGYVGT